MTEDKRFNCHVKFSKMPNGIMVLDYAKHGDDQTVIEDINREKAHRVMERLNELSEENEQLELKLLEVKKDEKELSIDFLGYKMKLIEVLQKIKDSTNNNDYTTVLVNRIAEEMGVDLE